jgi:RNA polymerase sigma-70 factor, ECF subfamily
MESRLRVQLSVRIFPLLLNIPRRVVLFSLFLRSSILTTCGTNTLNKTSPQVIWSEGGVNVMSATQPDLTRTQALPILLRPEPASPAAELEQEVVLLFEAHRSRLLAYVLAFGLSGHDGEEVIQEVFLSLFRHLQMGRSRSNLRGWIFRVAHNLALKQRQANQRWRDPLELEAGWPETHRDPAPDPEQQAVSAQRQQRLSSVVSALPEQDQWCLSLRAEGLRYREIAQVLGISLGSVSISLTRSMARLLRADEL